jgi:hypothetical protein
VIELVVVLLMVFFLIALCAPAVVHAQTLSAKQACAANLHDLGLAWQMMRRDCDGEWTRALPAPGRFRPQAVSDLAALGYLDDLDTYICPSLDAPHTRRPELNRWDEEWPEVQQTVYAGDMIDTCYFADEFRISREPLEQRVVMGDGIEMVTRWGKEPANHPDGSNLLFADMAVQWSEKFLPDREWVMDQHKVWDFDSELVGAPGHYGILQRPRDEYFPHCRSGTWRRKGFIQNPRLLTADPSDSSPGGGAGNGEDDIPNNLNVATGLPNDVDDVYYVDCDSATYGQAFGDACKWGFMSFALSDRCPSRASRSKKDAALTGGSPYNWRGNYGADWMECPIPEAFGGMTWGHPDEL